METAVHYFTPETHSNPLMQGLAFTTGARKIQRSKPRRERLHVRLVFLGRGVFRAEAKP